MDKMGDIEEKKKGGQKKKTSPKFLHFCDLPCAGGQLQGFKGLELDVNATGRARASPALLVRHSGWIYG